MEIGDYIRYKDDLGEILSGRIVGFLDNGYIKIEASYNSKACECLDTEEIAIKISSLI